jgi:hypothetical protein
MSTLSTIGPGKLPAGIANQSIQIARPVTMSVHGSEVADWSQEPAEIVTVLGCSVQPIAGDEDRAHRDQLGARIRLFTPAGVAIGALDRVWLVDHPGESFRAVSEAMTWSPGFLDHVQFLLAAWEG